MGSDILTLKMCDGHESMSKRRMVNALWRGYFVTPNMKLLPQYIMRHVRKGTSPSGYVTTLPSQHDRTVICRHNNTWGWKHQLTVFYPLTVIHNRCYYLYYSKAATLYTVHSLIQDKRWVLWKAVMFSFRQKIASSNRLPDITMHFYYSLHFMDFTHYQKYIYFCQQKNLFNLDLLLNN